MFLGLGLGAYSAGVFHLMTHAFFKALLFLGAGSVIHGLSGEQDLRHMGGLRKAMPITFVTLGIASLSISGFPFFAGFYSKDAILAAAYESASPWMFWVGAATAGMTAFYVFRAYFLTFFGKYRGHHHPHESPFVMTFPLMVLAVFSIGAGKFLSVPEWLAPMFPVTEHGSMQPMIISASFGIGGILLATLLYVIVPSLSDSVKSAAGPIYTLLANKYYVDELYAAVIVKPLTLISRTVLWRGVDEGLIDTGLVNGLGRVAQALGEVARRWQSGSIRNSATWILAGSLLLIFILGLGVR
jgi:NADH-quinone oxidoreductase subunit L